MTDEQLVALFQKGDKTAGEKLLVKYKSNVLKIARRFFIYGGETEDLVQEGMCGLYSAMVTYSRQNADFSTYAYKCVRNRIIDAVKASANNKNSALNNFLPISDDGEEFGSGTQNPEDELIKSEDTDELILVMKNNLSQLEFKVMSLYVEGVPISEISQSLKKPYKTIDNAIMRSKRKLQKIFKGE